MVKGIYIICLILILILPGCIFDIETAVHDQEDEASSNIELKLYFGTTTRAVIESEVGNNDENFLGLNEKNFKVAVFNGEGVYLGNFEPTETYYPIAGENYVALLKGKLNKTLIGENPTLQLMMLVNWYTFGNEYPENFYGKNLNDLYEDNESYNYTMYGENPTGSWKPSAREKKGIPMFGISKKITLPEDMVSEEDKETLKFSINLIRCMAKITVENNFKDEFGEAGYNIKSISLSKYNKKGTLIPHEWKDNWKEVTNPWLPKTESGEYDLNEGINLNLFKEADKEGENSEIWAVYIPEADYYTGSGEKPVLNFTIEAGGKTFDKELPLFGDFNKESNGTLLRNNIYNYKITIEKKNISLVYTVCPWYEGYNATFDYN